MCQKGDIWVSPKICVKKEQIWVSPKICVKNEQIWVSPKICVKKEQICVKKTIMPSQFILIIMISNLDIVEPEQFPITNGANFIKFG